jgi:hypothetical protein
MSLPSAIEVMIGLDGWDSSCSLSLFCSHLFI